MYLLKVGIATERLCSLTAECCGGDVVRPRTAGSAGKPQWKQRAEGATIRGHAAERRGRIAQVGTDADQTSVRRRARRL